MISIVTGTLNRVSLLPKLIDNTINSCSKLELILVDGGSTDGTINYIKELKHPQIKFIEVGGRSTYPHFMNLGIENSSFDWVCQWTDDALLVNNWENVICELEDKYNFYLFNWKYGTPEDMSNENWLNGLDTTHPNGGWCIFDMYDTHYQEIVMNYGIYNKKIFREIGMYCSDFNYYYTDGDMSRRAHLFGYTHKSLNHIKVCSINGHKQAYMTENDFKIYVRNHEEYKKGFINNSINFLL